MRTFPNLFKFGVSAAISALVAKRVLSCLWELTYRCTAKCSICSYWKNPSDPRDELPLEGIKEGLNKIHSYGCRAVNFTGGEPTLRQDLQEIVSNASALGMWTSLVTNGSLLTQERVRDLKDAGLDNLLVSLDSRQPEIHDRQRGMPGSHEQVERSTRWISEDFLTGHRTGGVMTVLTNLNVDDVDRIVQYADRLGVYVLVQPYHANKTGSAESSPDISPDLGNEMARIKRKRKNVLNSYHYLRELPHFYERAERQQCHAGHKYFSIDPFGRLHPCVDMPGFGHLLKDDISVVSAPEAMRSVETCEGCWYSFRGESDATLSFEGCFDKLRLGFDVMIRNHRLNRLRQRVG